MKRDSLALRRSLVGVVALFPLLVLPPASAQDTSKNPAYMGVGSCSSSNCHGSVSPRQASSVLQNEYSIWEKHDVHSKAWINLTNEDSKKIAENLGISSPEKDPLCLDCHATYLGANARQGANYHLEDGVGCESCHGAAENYLGPHTANDATHKRNIELGMTDLLSIEKRVELCASCHFGTNNKYVDHRLIGAGHPRLSFELDTFSMIQPRHWVVDEDYVKRKEDYNSAEAWLKGQVYLARRTVERLGSEKLSKHGIFPELTIFYCFACHHSLTEDQWKVRDYGGQPGELQLNVSSIVIVREALKAINPSVAGPLEESLQSLHSSYRLGDNKDLKTLEKHLSLASQAVENASFSPQLLGKLLSRLAGFCADGKHQQYEVAEQVAMGMSSILAAMGSSESLYKDEVDAIYAALKQSEEFNAAAFTEACGKLSKKL
ncbi:MAG: hypothetical protein J5J00_04040 [Deltaproteobacteria bacterium]|nr:hypothetical protein [Deltaproteobacteria bacterium]